MSSAFEYKEVVGISTESIEAAIQVGLKQISQTVEVAWFEVLSMRGRMVDDDTVEHQVSIKVGCRAK
ncbi:MAG: dodecin domain-containing protein [Bacteroidetes bacterium]|nr:dodecin domain-containing protein [Bacteroidota bacterium]